MTEDRRPDAKPRKNIGLWQWFCWYDDLVRMRTRHANRMTSSERGKSAMSFLIERDVLERMQLDEHIKFMDKQMIEAGKAVGPIWDWLTSIKGLGTGHLAAQLLALTDDIGKFDYISKYWRFCGLAVIDGKAERGTPNYCRQLKALLLGDTLIVDQFIRQRTPVYRKEYDREKYRLRLEHPDPVCTACGSAAVLKSQTWTCPNKCKVRSGFKVNYTPLHIDKMAKRKVAKMFLAHLWLQWREYEGLPITLPWILREGTGHTHFIEAPEMEIVTG